jgi:hypothetical protein
LQDEKAQVEGRHPRLAVTLGLLAGRFDEAHRDRHLVHEVSAPRVRIHPEGPGAILESNSRRAPVKCRKSANARLEETP